MSGLSFVVDPEDGSAEAAERARRAERALREIHETNNLEQLEFDNEIDCSVLGDGAYKVTWDTNEKGVRVTAPAVQGLFVWPWGDDASRLWRVAARYVLRHEGAEMVDGGRAGPGRGGLEPARPHRGPPARGHDRRGRDGRGGRAGGR